MAKVDDAGYFPFFSAVANASRGKEQIYSSMGQPNTSKPAKLHPRELELLWNCLRSSSFE